MNPRDPDPPVTPSDGVGLASVELPDDLSYTGPDGPETHRALASRIELAVADRLPDLIAVHAGVVADGRGAVLLPGRSMSGKSTLTEALVGRGATYFSDEFALIDRPSRPGVSPVSEGRRPARPGGYWRTDGYISAVQQDHQRGGVVLVVAPGPGNCVWFSVEGDFGDGSHS